jgi:hypothetical protein
MNKKAEFNAARKTIYWAIAGIVITIFVLGLAILLANHVNQLTKTSPKLKAEYIALRFTNIPECFAYEDKSSGKVHPGIIDLDKFNRKQMDQCYFTEEEKGFQEYNFGLSLKEEKINLSTNNFFNNIDFTLSKKVVVKKGDHFLEDTLLIYVQEKI